MASARPTSGESQVPSLHSEVNRPASIISSRLSGDGSRFERQNSITSKDPTSPRPGTAKTARSYLASPRQKRVSGVSAFSGNSSLREATSPRLPSRSHVPSLTSNAFFRPMSSQKLQAHRAGVSRPPTMSLQAEQPSLDDGATDAAIPRHSLSSNGPFGIQRMASGDDTRPPPSPGTEMTDMDRITANTSPTNGHYPAGSLSDSHRPLHRTSSAHRQGLAINTDKSYQDAGKSTLNPIISPRSLRSSFMLSGRSDSVNRNTEGAEKLSSGASSPKFNRVDSHGWTTKTTLPGPNQDGKAGHVHEYFDGNTNFCFGGRWQNTKGRPINLATGFFILLPCALFFGFEAPWLWHNISPVIPIIFAYIAFICMSSFIHASISDPGVCTFFQGSPNHTDNSDSTPKSTRIPAFE